MVHKVHGNGLCPSGNKATFTVNLDPGTLEQFPQFMEPQLRQLGLPTALKKGGDPAVRLRGVQRGCDVLTSNAPAS